MLPTTSTSGSLAHLLSSEFCKISKNTFFTGHLRTTPSGTSVTATDIVILQRFGKVQLLFKYHRAVSVWYSTFTTFQLHSILVTLPATDLLITCEFDEYSSTENKDHIKSLQQNCSACCLNELTDTVKELF